MQLSELNRPEFLRLMADAKLRKIESLLTLENFGIRFLAPQGIDTDQKSK